MLVYIRTMDRVMGYGLWLLHRVQMIGNYIWPDLWPEFITGNTYARLP
jgi:hypothetical protein